MKYSFVLMLRNCESIEEVVMPQIPAPTSHQFYTAHLDFSKRLSEKKWPKKECVLIQNRGDRQLFSDGKIGNTKKSQEQAIQKQNQLILNFDPNSICHT